MDWLPGYHYCRAVHPTENGIRNAPEGLGAVAVEPGAWVSKVSILCPAGSPAPGSSQIQVPLSSRSLHKCKISLIYVIPPSSLRIRGKMKSEGLSLCVFLSKGAKSWSTSLSYLPIGNDEAYFEAWRKTTPLPPGSSLDFPSSGSLPPAVQAHSLLSLPPVLQLHSSLTKICQFSITSSQKEYSGSDACWWYQK